MDKVGCRPHRPNRPPRKPFGKDFGWQGNGPERGWKGRELRPFLPSSVHSPSVVFNTIRQELNQRWDACSSREDALRSLDSCLSRIVPYNLAVTLHTFNSKYCLIDLIADQTLHHRVIDILSRYVPHYIGGPGAKGMSDLLSLFHLKDQSQLPQLRALANVILGDILSQLRSFSRESLAPLNRDLTRLLLLWSEILDQNTDNEQRERDCKIIADLAPLIFDLAHPHPTRIFIKEVFALNKAAKMLRCWDTSHRLRKVWDLSVRSLNLVVERLKASHYDQALSDRELIDLTEALATAKEYGTTLSVTGLSQALGQRSDRLTIGELLEVAEHLRCLDSVAAEKFSQKFDQRFYSVIERF